MTRLLVDLEIAEGLEISIKGDELHYLVRVRRHGSGDSVELIDSDGSRFEALVSKVSRDQASVRVLRRLPSIPDALPVHLIIAVPKRNLLDDVVRKSSEMGLARITPVTTERSVVVPSDGKVERWRKIASESVRQCNRLRPIVVDDVLDLNSALKSVEYDGLRAILHPREGSLPIIDLFARRDLGSAVIAIGPEGGFTEDEVRRAGKADFRPVGLGSFVLRVETAALMAAALSVAFVGGLD